MVKARTPSSEKEEKTIDWLRNPFVIVLAILVSIGTAFQVAGVTSMLLAKVFLAAGVWIFDSLEEFVGKLGFGQLAK